MKLEEELKKLNIDLNQVIENALTKSEELLKLNKITEATILLKQLLVVDPSNKNGLQLYGLILYRQGKYLESIDVQKKAILADENNPENHSNIALSYLHSGNVEEAKKEIEKAVEITPNDYNRLNNAGLIYRAAGDIDKSISYFKNAIKINPTNSIAWENLGSIYGSLKDLDEAKKCFEEAIKLNPDDLAAHVDLAYTYHLKGEWEKAWPEYEHRIEYWHSVGRNPGRFYDIYKPEKKLKKEDSVNGKNIVIYCEQGNGDIIQFARFIPKLIEKGANVFFHSPPELDSLLSTIPNLNVKLPEEYDYHCSILSLPYLLDCMTSDKFLSNTPYFIADEEKKVDLSDYKETFNIGLCWAGNPGHPNDGNRSIYLKQFENIANMANIKLFSLQKDLSKRVYTNLPGVEIDLTKDCDNLKIVDLSHLLSDYKATANIIDSLDLVITVDTSILHLAGSIGKETWALIPFNPDWRWTLEGEKTVWYESVKLFRQTNPGDWSDVIQKIESELKTKVE